MIVEWRMKTLDRRQNDGRRMKEDILKLVARDLHLET